MWLLLLLLSSLAWLLFRNSSGSQTRALALKFFFCDFMTVQIAAISWVVWDS